MLRKLICFYVAFLAIACTGQNINTSFFDQNGYLTYEETAFYYRQNTDTANFYRSYYRDNNSRYFEGYIVNALDSADYNNKYAGTCRWYNKSGTLKLLAHFNEQGLLDGIKQEFNKNGVLTKQSVYENNVLKTDSYLEIDENSVSAIVFEEDFKNNNRGWLLGANGTTAAKIKLGGLELMNQKKNNYAVISAKKIDSVNFSIETAINLNYLTADGKSGIVFGFTDWNNYNYFYVSKFRFHIGSVQNGVLIKSIENYFSYELKGYNWNSIKVLSVGDSLYYYINNAIQSCCQKTGFSQGRQGLYVNNGNSFFDNFIIRQYSGAFNGKLQPEIAYSFNNYKLPAKQLNMGVLLGTNGYVLTFVKDFEQVNKFVIQLHHNDSIKEYEADVYFYNPLINFLVLKIRNGNIDSNIHIAYNYNYMNNCNTEKLMTSFSLERNPETGSLALDTVRINSMIINTPDHHLKGIVNSYLCVGSPLFNSGGHILGIITDVNKQNEIKVLNMQEINAYLYSNSKLFGLLYKNEVDGSTFKKNISTNIALVKSL